MVEDTETFSTNSPFTEEGREFTICLTNVFILSSKSASGNESLPTMACTFPPASVLYSILPALNSFTAVSISSVTVPDFGDGILPCGPSTLPSLPTSLIISEVEIATSKSAHPPSTFFTKSSAPTSSAPAFFANAAFSPVAKTITLRLLPMPFGNEIDPLISWSDCFGSIPNFIATSTLSLNFAGFSNFSNLTASFIPYFFSESTTFLDSKYLLLLFAILLLSLYYFFSNYPNDQQE